MTKTKLEEVVECMIALKRVTSPSGSISDRAKFRLDKYATEAYARLKEGQRFSDDSCVTANLDWRDETRAKGMALGIQEFSKKYPKYGKILDEIINEKHRKPRRTYIEFGLNSDSELPEEFYIQVIMSLGGEFTRTKSEKLFLALSEFWDRIGRVKIRGKYDILLPE